MYDFVVDLFSESRNYAELFAGGTLDNLTPLSSTEFGCAATNHYESSWGD